MKIALYLIFFPILSFAQFFKARLENITINNDDANKQIHVIYDINYGRESEFFKVEVKFISAISTKEYTATNLKGDLGDNIFGGRGKRIIWDYSKEAGDFYSGAQIIADITITSMYDKILKQKVFSLDDFKDDLGSYSIFKNSFNNFVVVPHKDLAYVITRKQINTFSNTFEAIQFYGHYSSGLSGIGLTFFNDPILKYNDIYILLNVGGFFPKLRSMIKIDAQLSLYTYKFKELYLYNKNYDENYMTRGLSASPQISYHFFLIKRIKLWAGLGKTFWANGAVLNWLNSRGNWLSSGENYSKTNSKYFTSIGLSYNF